jgi:uncharacterized protein (TIGR01777 family)
MKVVLTGGSGLIGRALIQSLRADGHSVSVLSRNPSRSGFPQDVSVVALSEEALAALVEGSDVVINLAGHPLADWPWTKGKKARFDASRVKTGQSVFDAVKKARSRPRVLIQASGINHYGLQGSLADETTPPGDDFLAGLTIGWEASTRGVEEFGVRWVAIRTAVVLAPRGGLLPLMSLPVRMFVGGRIGDGRNALPWIHLDDEVAAIRFLMDNQNARGPYNLVAPQAVTSAEFMQILAASLHRPYWFHVPAFLMRMVLGEMSQLVLDGRPAAPARLIEQGFHFGYPELKSALDDVFQQSR